MFMQSCNSTAKLHKISELAKYNINNLYFLSFPDADGEAAAGGHTEFQFALVGDFLLGDGVCLGVVAFGAGGIPADMHIRHIAAGVLGVGVDGGFVLDAGLQEVEPYLHLAGLLVGDATDVPGVEGL